MKNEKGSFDHRVRRLLERVFMIAGLIAGLSIVGSCTAVGFAAGPFEGIGLFIVSGVAATFLVGAVFLFTRMSRDVRLLNEELARSVRERDRDSRAPGENKDPGAS
jgi:hypothetical protein